MNSRSNSDIILERALQTLQEICDCGGRQAGSESEARAKAVLSRLGEQATGQPVRTEDIAYRGWAAIHGEITSGNGQRFPCNPLIWSPSTGSDGLRADILDLGRGTNAEFNGASELVRDRIVMVNHELMFSASTIHRRFKIAKAVELGAAGLLIVGPTEGSMVSGSSGRQGEQTIPSAGISPETAQHLRSHASAGANARLVIEVDESEAVTQNLFFEIPGEEDGWVVLSAHLDGHDLGESAMDNATGLVAALEAARAAKGLKGAHRVGLRLAFFNVEEWALTGSASHIAGLSKREREEIALNVNVDSVGFGGKLTALTSGFDGLAPFLQHQSDDCGIKLQLFPPLQANSDHANFAAAGVPAFRLVSGFDEPSAAGRDILTARDTRDRIDGPRLAEAITLCTNVTLAAMCAGKALVATWRGF